MDAVDAVLQAVRALALGLDRYRRALGATHGIGVAEIVTLGQLLYDGPVRAGEVSTRTGLTQSSVTALLDRLEARGYIVRVRPEGNRRAVMVEATAAGRELGHAIFDPLRTRLLAAAPDGRGLECVADCLAYTADSLDAAARDLAGS